MKVVVASVVFSCAHRCPGVEDADAVRCCTFVNDVPEPRASVANLYVSTVFKSVLGELKNPVNPADSRPIMWLFAVVKSCLLVPRLDADDTESDEKSHFSATSVG